MASVVDIPKTFGALLIGGLFAAILSGVVIVQVFVYFKLYPGDALRLKSLVVFIWFLDTCHTGFVWAALWEYLILYFGAAEKIHHIPWQLALTIVFTAILTFAVHCFFAHRIFMLSRRNWWLTSFLFGLAILRLVSACATTGEMIRLHDFPTFQAQFKWLFTLGLALSSLLDVLITCALFVLLQSSRSDASSNNINVVIDSLIRYAFETGFLTCAGTVVSMICYLAMSDNLIFMGLHFVISKFYATSLLITLNTRQKIRRARSQPSLEREFPTLRLDTRRRKASPGTSSTSPSSPRTRTMSETQPRKLEINVEQSVEYKSDSLNSPAISVHFPHP